MKHYLVTWKIDIYADSPIKAAEEAQLYQQTDLPRDWFFEVVDCDTKEVIEVDLELEHVKCGDDEE